MDNDVIVIHSIFLPYDNFDSIVKFHFSADPNCDKPVG